MQIALLHSIVFLSPFSLGLLSKFQLIEIFRIESLLETINGPVKILTCPFTQCGHKSLFLSYEFPRGFERSDK